MFIPITYFLLEIYVLYKSIFEINIIYKTIIESKKEKYSILKLIFNFILIFTILIQLIFSIFVGTVYILEKINVSVEEFSYNVDKKTISEKYDIDGVWIASRYNTSCIDLIRNEDDPMYNADIIVDIDPMMNVKSSYSDFSKEIFFKKIKRRKIIYSFKRKVF